MHATAQLNFVIKYAARLKVSVSLETLFTQTIKEKTSFNNRGAHKTALFVES